MASKKKRKLSKKQLKQKRSAAAKKGWETRRKRAYEKRFNALNPELEGIEKSEALQAMLEQAREEGRRLALKEMTNKAVVDEMVRQGKIKDDRESIIKARLRRTGGPDSPDYYDEVQDIYNDDDYSDMTLSEIYTIGFY